MSTIVEVSKLAGVSRTTVSRYINRSGYVSEAAKARIEAAIQELNYHPNRLAQSLHTKTSSFVSLVIGDISNPITAVYTKAVEEAAFKNNHNLILCNTGFEIEKEIEYVNSLLRSQVDGVIIAPCFDPASEHLKQLENRGVPLVFLTRKKFGIKGDYVHFDNVQGTYQVISHLISLGHTSIGAIVRRMDREEIASRLDGYKLALKENNMPLAEENIQYTAANERGGYEGIAKLMASENKPTAVFTATNVQAIGVIKYCKENRIKIPNDLAIGSFESFYNFDSLISPELTANIMPVDELGRVAAELLFERLRGERVALKEICLSGSLVIRESTVNKQCSQL